MAKIEVYGTQKVLLGVVYCRNSRNTKSIKGTNHRVLGWLGPFLPILPFCQKYPLFLPWYPPKVPPPPYRMTIHRLPNIYVFMLNQMIK